MDFTFKQEERQRSLPFLQRFKDKINKVNRLSGLCGALGILNKQQNLKHTQNRLYTAGNEHKINSQASKRSNSVHSQSRFRDVVVNRFKTHADDENDMQENIDLNARQQSQKTDKCEQTCLRGAAEAQTEQVRTRTANLKALLLPKIGGASVDVTEQGVRMKLRRTKQYQKYRNMKLLTKKEMAPVSLR